MRTRRDIVAAAIECWAADNSASLGEVAVTAGVGRTTLNRYFSDRAQLISAVDAECRARFAAAVGRARPAEGSGLTALLRACGEIVHLGPVLGLIFADNALVDPDTWERMRQRISCPRSRRGVRPTGRSRQICPWNGWRRWSGPRCSPAG